jgi:hypothetical protein
MTTIIVKILAIIVIMFTFGTILMDHQEATSNIMELILEMMRVTPK